KCAARVEIAVQADHLVPSPNQHRRQNGSDITQMSRYQDAHSFTPDCLLLTNENSSQDASSNSAYGIVYPKNAASAAWLCGHSRFLFGNGTRPGCRAALHAPRRPVTSKKVAPTLRYAGSIFHS